MANKTNLENLLFTIRTTSDLYKLQRVSRTMWAVTHAVCMRKDGKNYIVLTSETVNGKKHAIARMRAMVHPVTLALFDGLCTNHTGKMTGVISFSTYCGLNPHCLQRAAVPGSICSKCFAFRQTKRQASTRQKLIRNTLLINSEKYAANLFPIIDRVYNQFRFESFGDLMSENQAANYLMWASVNRRAHCALWTKNPWHIAAALNSGSVKPANLNIIFSSNFINKIENNIFNLYPFIDKLFTVFTDTAAATACNVKINCGKRSCKKCRRCYLKNTGKFVNELLK